MEADKDWLTARDIATRYGISVRTAHRWIRGSRALHALRVGPGGRIRVHRNDLANFERERYAVPSASTAA